MHEDDTIGARIATERKLRGLTQHQLASRAHLSVSLLRKVEQGSRPASPALMAAVGTALGLGQAHLTEQPYNCGDHRVDALHDLIPPMRHELCRFSTKGSGYRSPRGPVPRPSLASR